MFICAKCGESKRHGALVTLETREKEYFEKRGPRGKEEDVYVGSGFETAREARHCNDCLGIAAPEPANQPKTAAKAA